MITLYHDTLSAPARAARLACGEYGAETELVEEHVWEKRQGFAALNPALTLPVMEADGVTVVGIHPVLEYIEDTRGGAVRTDGEGAGRRLHSANPATRAETRRLVDWFLGKMDEEVTRHLVRERVEKLIMPRELGGGSPNSAAMRIARANVKHHMRYLEWLAGSRAWMAGDALTYADLAAGAAVSVLDYLGEISWEESPYAKDWYGRIKSRPSFRPLLADRVKRVSPSSHYADLDF